MGDVARLMTAVAAGLQLAGLGLTTVAISEAMSANSWGAFTSADLAPLLLTAGGVALMVLQDRRGR